MTTDKMDPSAVITQVSQNADSTAAASSGQQQADSGSSSQQQQKSKSDNNNGSGAVAANAAAASGGSRLNANSSSQNQLSQSSTTQKASKKSRSSNFLCSIICCFGKRGGGSSRREKQDGNSGAIGLTPADSNGANSRTGDAVDGPNASAGGGGRSAAVAVPGGSSGDRGGHSSGGSGGGHGPKSKHLLPELRPEDAHKKCIIIDLDETLVHSSFKPINNADFIVPVEIDGTIHQVYVLKRPHVDEFLVKMGELYECVLFTASLAKYADPVTDLLDKWDVFRYRLFRESCVFHRGNYVKDLSRLGREIHKVLIVDNSPASYIFHPENAVPCASWFDDMNDQELLEFIPFLETVSKSDNIYALLQQKFRPDSVNGGGMGGLSIHGGGGPPSPSPPLANQIQAQVEHSASSVITSVQQPQTSIRQNS